LKACWNQGGESCGYRDSSLQAHPYAQGTVHGKISQGILCTLLLLKNLPQALPGLEVADVDHGF